MKIHSVIPELWDGKRQERSFEAFNGLMVHRVGVNARTGQVIGTNALDIGRAFIGKRPEWAEVARATGGQNAYTFMIGGHRESPGQIWQCLPLSEIGWHGLRFSRGWIGIALIGDYREEELHHKTLFSLIDLCKKLCSAYSLDPLVQLKGHGEVPNAHGGEKAPGMRHACPGDKVPMDDIRWRVKTEMEDESRASLLNSGVVF